MEFAKTLGETIDIEKLSVRDVAFPVPIDTSLNSDLYDRFSSD